MVLPRENVIIVLTVDKTIMNVLNFNFLSLISFQLNRGHVLLLTSFVCVRGAVFSSVVNLSTELSIIIVLT
jgi:hypothetical protein